MTTTLLVALLVALPLGQEPPADASTALEPVESPAPQDIEPAPAAEAEGPAPSELEYQVGSGDVLEVEVIGNDDLSRLPTVQTNGAILLPLLGEVQVAGLNVAEIQRKVTNLLEKDYLVNPQVVVKVSQYNSQYVTVVGEVNSPGRKPLRGRTRLIDVLAEAAEGFTTNASGVVVITREDGTFPGGERTLTVRLSRGTPSLQDQINLELPLRNGDIITASQKYFVTVDGEVNKPGRYAVESDLTVTGALSLAGGRTRFGADDVRVRRKDPDTGEVTVIKIDLDDVRDGKKPDLALLPNDVIDVPRRFF
ncbi:MAG: polysaccharide export protein [Acidobacteria bacterium]|nr:polysaccharide export protein [Acidobacteriota bacterium]